MDNYAEVFGTLIGRARDEAIDALTDNRASSQLHVAAGSEPQSEPMNVAYEDGAPVSDMFRFDTSGFGGKLT